MSKTKKTLTVVIVLAALMALAGTVIVLAQVLDDKTLEEQDNTLLNQRRRNEIRALERLGQRWPGGADINYDALLAEALDITTDELQDAREEAFTAAVELAAEEEYITQRQADMILALRTMKGIINEADLVANALGISIEELQEARQNHALRQLLEDLDLNPADIRASVLEGYEELVDQAVEDDLLTEEQAEILKDRPGLLLRNPRDMQRQTNNQGRGTGGRVQDPRGRGSGGNGQFQGGNRFPAPSGGN
jgi:hypothetical protein